MRNPVTICRTVSNAPTPCKSRQLVTGVLFWVRVIRNVPVAVAVYTFGLHQEVNSGGLFAFSCMYIVDPQL